MDITSLEKSAIQAAFQGTWEKAKELNKNILANDPENIPALNRLAKTYWETGEIKSALKTYKKVLSNDPSNTIALKNIQKLTNYKKRVKVKTQDKLTAGGFFLEEPGKTKIIKLSRLNSPEALAQFDSGGKLTLIPKKRFIAVQSPQGTYLGTIPEDISWRLISLIKGGNRYEAIILAVTPQDVEIFIRETFRSTKFKNVASF